MRAPCQQQRVLLKIQSYDTKIKRLNFKLKNLPQTAEIDTLNEKLQKLKQIQGQIAVLIADKGSKVTAIKTELEQLEKREQIQNERLMAGSAKPKELLALEAEIAQIGKRKEKLNGQLAEETQEKQGYQDKAKLAEDKRVEIQGQLEKLQQLREQEAAAITSEIATLQSQRDNLVTEVSSELMQLYQEVSQRTGGVGAIRVEGTHTPGLELEFSVAEANRILSADPEEVLLSEEYDYILVRYPQA